MAYLDHAATTPMLPEAVAAMTAELGSVGNASSLHTAGRRARRVVEESRETVAALLGARPSEVVFTSGGTEADNLAVKGLSWQRRDADPARRRVLASAIEHHAVLDPVVWLGSDSGTKVELLPVDRYARVDMDAVTHSVTTDPASVALVTVMWANNEVGTVQPISDIVSLVHEYDIPLHVDAVQAVGHLDVDFAASGVDSLAVSGHKFGGPGGVGVLLLRKELSPVPLLHGGGQERDVRSGTLDVPAIASFAAGLEAAMAERRARNARVMALRQRLIEGVLREVPDAILNGDPLLDEAHRLPGIAHFTFPGCEGDALLLLLDARGIECSTGSACSAGVAQPSHVLLAMGVDDDLARGSLRFSLGHTSTQADVDLVIESIAPIVERARAAGLAGARS